MFLLSIPSVVADPRPDADDRLAGADDLAVLFQVEEHAELAGTVEHLLAYVAAFDLALAGLVRLAVRLLLGERAVAEIPLDGRTVVLLVIVRPALDIHREDGAERREAHGRRGLHVD